MLSSGGTQLKVVEKAGRDGLEVFPVKADDLCVYLTSRKREGSIVSLTELV